jgi:hypothetical protein
MVKLDLDLPLPAPVEDLKIQPRYTELVAAMELCEFRSLLQEIKNEVQANNVTPSQGELF